MRIVFKQQPLSFHKFAQEAAEASLAANEQGKFWEYHDLLFANQKALARADLERYAQQIGLDMAKFKEALDTHKFAEKIKQDQAIAAKVGASGTPTSFVNGYKVRGASPYPAFKAIIDRELAKARGGGAAPAGRGEAGAAVDLNLSGALAVGPERAKDTVVVFADLQDPKSREVIKTLREIQKARRDVRLVLEHFPQGSHRQAHPAAQVILAAAEQDGTKAWKLVDAVVDSGKLAMAELQEQAKAAGLDAAKLETDVRSRKFKAAVDADMAEARKARVTSPPAVFVNGRMLPADKGYDKATLTAAL